MFDAHAQHGTGSYAVALAVTALILTACVTVDPKLPGVTGTISPEGGGIELTGVATATFPADSFNTPRTVRLYREDLDSIPGAYTDSILINGVEAQSAYQVVLSVGTGLPRSDSFKLSIQVPDDFLALIQDGASIRAFARVTQEHEDEVLDSYEVIPSRYDAGPRTLTVDFNKAWLTQAHGPGAAFEAVVAFVTIPGGRRVASAQATATVHAETDASCKAKTLGPPLSGDLEVSGDPPRGFDPVPSEHPVNGRRSAHWGTDLRAAQGSPVLAAESGTIERVKFRGPPASWPTYPDGGAGGQYIVIRHADGSKTKYMHLSGVAAGIEDGEVVTKGQPIGLSGGTRGTPGAGGSTGPHLHFEYAPNGAIYANDTTAKVDPFPCLTDADATGSILVFDDGPANDDVFEVRLDGILLGRTPKGGSDTFGLSNLRAGTKTLSVTCTDDGLGGADVGTLGVVLSDGVTFEAGGTTRSTTLRQGASIAYRIVVPSAATNLARAPATP